MKKEILKKYWWVGLLVVVLPIIFNLCYLIPAFAEIFEEPKGWTIFWGSYLGAIISGAVAFVVLHKQLEQNHQENNTNRDNQRRTVEFQQEKLYLEELKESLLDYYKGFQMSEVLCVCEKAKKQNYGEYEELIKQLQCFIDTKKQYDFNLYLKRPVSMDTVEQKFFNEVKKFDLECYAMLEDLKWFLWFVKGVMLQDIPNHSFFEEIDQYTQHNGFPITDNRVYSLIREYDCLVWQYLEAIINRRLESKELFSEDKVIKTIKSFVDYETTKINKILTDGI